MPSAKELKSLAVIVLSLIEALHIMARPERGTPLSDYISHYEPLFYDTRDLHTNHHRAKRSTDRVLKLDLEAHGRSVSTTSGMTSLSLPYFSHSREFRLRLRRDTSVFTSDAVLENSTGQFYYDTKMTYTGHLSGQKGSHVSGVVTSEGVFEGSINTPQEQYVIEKADRFFSDKQPFHSVIYKVSDVHMDRLQDSLCKSDELHRKLRRWQEEEGRERRGEARDPRVEARSSGRERQDEPRSAGRRRRDIRPALDPTKTTCTLYLQADHLFYENFDRNEERVVEVLTQHIQGVNEIYRAIDFDGDGEEDAINFIIKRIKVHTNSNHPEYKFQSSYGVESFLERFSEDNFDPYCLAYMFTYRDFEGGTLGLAWTGDIKNAGGVCERNDHFRGSLKSLNTGIVTLLNYGKNVPSCVSHVTMAHELGHNMGSQHDPETSQCSPGGEEGNYIMYARATSGDKPNNNRFSKCSQRSMATIMADKARDGSLCFIPATSSICGNGVVEAGEECDCGWEDECRENCCYPQTEHPHTDGHNVPCTRKHYAKCSPSEGPCCSDGCFYIKSDEQVTCRLDSDCQYGAICNGKTSVCPPSVNKPDKLPCDGDTSVCYEGACAASVCMVYGLETCQCPALIEEDFINGRMCMVCCKLSIDGAPCRSSFEWNDRPFDVPDLMVRADEPCNDYQGYCDVFHRCHEIDALGNLKSMFFSSEGLHSLRAWLTQNWYVALAAAVGLLTFTAILVKVCSSRKKAQASAAIEMSSAPQPIMTPTEPPERLPSMGAYVRIKSSAMSVFNSTYPTHV